LFHDGERTYAAVTTLTEIAAPKETAQPPARTATSLIEAPLSGRTAGRGHASLISTA
jgi:hypothetical protein